MAATILKMRTYTQLLVNDQQQRVKNALLQIHNQERHLLALRGYIRFSNRINERWAMSTAEENEFRETPEWQTMQRETRSIQQRFASSHRGYTLSVNMRARSLDQQIRLWNNNDTVLALGTRLRQLILVELDSSTTYPEPPTEASKEACQNWISQSPNALRLNATVRRRSGNMRINSPSNATPGLSSHGQIRALDFVVRRGRAIIAGADMGQRNTVWRGVDNWLERLNNAVTAESNSWEGPLQNPDEPWHYTYNP